MCRVLVRKNNSHRKGGQGAHQRQLWWKDDVVSVVDDVVVEGTRDGEAHIVLLVPGTAASSLQVLIQPGDNDSAKRKHQVNMGDLSSNLTGPQRAELAQTGRVTVTESQILEVLDIRPES